MMRPTLETRDLTIGYRRRAKGDIILARGLNLRLERGKLIGLLGPNGVGKSTLIRTLARMQGPLAGRVFIEGQDLASLTPLSLARCLSLVLTATPWPRMMNGFGLVALGRHPYSDWLGRLTADDYNAVARAISAVGADELAEQPLSDLSDGQRQKLMIARALAQEAGIMLLDEPTAYLDLPRRVETMRLLKHLAQSTRRAILVSTHDLDQALRSCDQLWLMSESSIEIGAPEDLALSGRLADTFRAAGIHFDMSSGAFAPAPPPSRPVRLVGAGAPAIWMTRALARAGYQLNRDARGIEIVSESNGGGPQWQLRLNGSLSVHSTIQSVLEALENADP
ncbi:MAG: ABC transporter ATP-binding protein [Chloroflexi bacterium]|nr:ABC transporter ATP-binding protein [Chloroflexota bacterium]